MITEQQLRSEIERIKADMATASEGQRDYMIGALAALMWAAGDYDRGTALQLAAQAWDQTRPGPKLRKLPIYVGRRHGNGAARR